LRPSMLDDLGLLATIKWYCRSRSEMHTDVRIETKLALTDGDVPDYSKIVIYPGAAGSLEQCPKAQQGRHDPDKVRGRERSCPDVHK
jgi:signal transduction histidine kinase